MNWGEVVGLALKSAVHPADHDLGDQWRRHFLWRLKLGSKNSPEVSDTKSHDGVDERLTQQRCRAEIGPNEP
jgi:hypothetical protein